MSKEVNPILTSTYFPLRHMTRPPFEVTLEGARIFRHIQVRAKQHSLWQIHKLHGFRVGLCFFTGPSQLSILTGDDGLVLQASPET